MPNKTQNTESESTNDTNFEKTESVIPAKAGIQVSQNRKSEQENLIG